MDSSTFLGMMITALVVIVGLFISLCTPIIKLNKTIQKLNDSIDRLNEEADKRDGKLEAITSSLHTHAMWLSIDKKRLDNQAERLKKIDNEVGIRDDSQR